jgi:hypothetical protein
MFETRSSRRRRASQVKSEPTPDMIRTMAEEIQKTWTPRERLRRANRMHPYYITEMPLVPRRKGFCD